MGAYSLQKDEEKAISLDKRDPKQILTATLEWQGRRFGRKSDLELVALRIPSQGSPTRLDDIYWAHLGNPSSAPFVHHHGDAQRAGSETVTVHNLWEHSYVGFFVYSAVQNGAGSLFSYRARVTVTDGNGQTITAPLYNDQESYWGSIAVADFTKPGGVTIRQDEKYGVVAGYHNGHHYSSQDAERWPVLDPNGQIRMSAGRVEFKR